MVAKKGDVKKTTSTGGRKVSAKSSVKKDAIKKLKETVNEAKQEEINVEKSAPVKNVKKTSSVFVKIDNKQNEQHEGKIAEIKNGVAYATGHRKRSIAKVSCKEKSGALSVVVNKMEYNKFFTKLIHQDIVVAPFVLLGINSGYVVNAEVFGGGKSGQADALKLGLSRCLSALSEEYGKVLRKNSFLTRDARKVEPKKAGLKKARKKEQFSKR